VYEVAKYSKYCEEFIEASQSEEGPPAQLHEWSLFFCTMNETVNKVIVAVLPYMLFC
jgi:hypothetical protein